MKTDIMDIINPCLNSDHIVFAVQLFEVKMEKKIQDVLLEPKIIKLTYIRINQLNLLDVRAHQYQKINEFSSQYQDCS